MLEKQRKDLWAKGIMTSNYGWNCTSQGMIAEMKTGEGKTLVSTLAAYLNSLNNGSVHIVTVNDYLAKRDSEWMGAVFKKLGLRTDFIVSGLNDEERKKCLLS